MLTALRTASDDRLRQAFLLLQNIKKLDEENGLEENELLKILKGMFFIALYACIEHILTKSVSDFLLHIQSAPAAPKKYKQSLLPTLLNSELNSLINSSKKNIWQSKSNLISRIFDDAYCAVDNNVFPTDGTNITYDHFQEIWLQLSLPGKAIPPEISHWVVNEIKEHRNAIAHGREKASTIGGRFSVAALESRYRQIEKICTNTIICFQDHINQKTYLAN